MVRRTRTRSVRRGGVTPGVMPTEAEKTASKQKVSTLQEDIEKAADDDAKGEVLKTFFSNATPYEMMLLANSIQRNSGRDVAEDAAAKAREMGLGQTAGRRRGRKYRSTRRR